jgi:5'-deoxynucleotidase YfbR-like HD superfamily hydrolase
MLLAPHFADMDGKRALELAIVHDKLELFTGDLDPLGPDGQGTHSHAFNSIAQAEKTAVELAALDKYLAHLRPAIRDAQHDLILETIHSVTTESRFVKAVDKLQALTFVLAKKAGTMTDEHLAFSLRYSAKAIEYFPGLAAHHSVLVRRLLEVMAVHRKVDARNIASRLPDAVQPVALAAF